jgi:hypothetical protein
VVGAVLLVSFAIFSAQARDTPSQPPPVRMLDPKAQVLRELAREIHLEPEVVRQMALEEPIVVEPVVEPAPWEAPPIVAPVPARHRRRRPIAQANSPSEALRWLTWQQGAIPLVFLGLACFVAGACMPFAGQVLWPVVTLLIGLGCGTATFGWEQSDLSYQFLAAQHFPLKTIWNVKILFWLTAALLATGLLIITGIVLVILMAAAGPGHAARFDLGTVPEIMGYFQFFGLWLAYGFAVAQLIVLFCRKTVYAVILSAMVSAAAIGLWAPSLLGRGMSGWQAWAAPLAMLLTTRALMRAWAGGRIKERKPLAALIGVGLALLAWAGVNFGYLAWHIPDTAEPLDRLAFRAALPAADANPAGKKIQEALSEFESAEGKKEVWQARMAEVSLLPLGVIEAPVGDGQSAPVRHLTACRKLVGKLLTGAKEKRDLAPAVAPVTQVLALSRNLRNKASLASYLAGVEAEQDALAVIESWVAREKPSPDLLRRVLAELDRHLAETPPPLDCLQTECYRAGGLLQNPIAWRMQAPNGASPERWLTGVIALSLDTPWENERIARLWRQVWAGLFRGVETPHWQLAELPADDDGGILAGWLPADDGLSRGELIRLMRASWLTDEKLFAPLLPLRQAATRSRWRVDAVRQAAALRLYQFREGKTAQKLDDLVPKCLPELPVDPYSGKVYQYRISKGENVEFPGDGRNLGQHFVQPGDGILWSTGPDRVDDGGRKHGAEYADSGRQWSRGGYDLIAIVPFWP